MKALDVYSLTDEGRLGLAHGALGGAPHLGQRARFAAAGLWQQMTEDQPERGSLVSYP